MNTLLLASSVLGTLAAIAICCGSFVPPVVIQSVPVLLLCGAFAGYRLWARNLR